MDLFLRGGGLSHGLLLEGFKVRAGIDVDATCRYACEHSNRVDYLTQDVAELSAARSTLYPKSGRIRKKP